MAITINNKYPLGSMVYLKTDNEQLVRQILSVEVFGDGSYQYKLACGALYSYSFEFELSTTRELVGEVVGGNHD